jgi:Uncharacterised nucleotidyltransferase
VSTASPAVEFLTAVVGGRPPGELPDTDGEGERTLELLHFHRLGGLAVAEARTRGDSVSWLDPGTPVGHRLRDRYLRTSLHGTLVIECARRARSALTAADIPSILLKGVALMLDGTYPDPGGRAVEDVDLLVPPEAAGSAVRALAGSGFQPWVEWDEARSRWLPAFSFTDLEAPDGFEVTLDLHWRTPYVSLRAGPAEGFDPIWRGADLESGLPAAEAHFLLMAEHFIKHLRVVTHVRGLADLARTVARVERPDEVVAMAKERRSLRGLRALSAFLRDSLDLPAAESMTGSPGPGDRSHRRSAKILDPERLFGMRGPVAEGRARGLLLQWSLSGPPWRALREAWNVLAPPGPWLESRYPEVGPGFGRRRARYLREVGAWIAGRGRSPLSPNQEFEE